MIIVDNFPESYLLQPNNGLPILSWYDDQFDKELQKMMIVLERLNQVDDVTQHIPMFVSKNKLSMYNLYKVIGEPRRESIIDSLVNLWKKETAIFFGINKGTDEEKSSDVDDEIADETPKIPNLNGAITQRRTFDPSPSEIYDRRGYNSNTSRLTTNCRTVRNRTNTLLSKERNSDDLLKIRTMPVRKKPLGVKVPQKDLLTGLIENKTVETRHSHQPKHRKTLSNDFNMGHENPEDAISVFKQVEQGEVSVVVSQNDLSDTSASFEEGGVCEASII